MKKDHYTNYPTGLRVTFHDDDWYRNHQRDRHYHWRQDRDNDYGYYSHGEWHPFLGDPASASRGRVFRPTALCAGDGTRMLVDRCNRDRAGRSREPGTGLYTFVSNIRFRLLL